MNQHDLAILALTGRKHHLNSGEWATFLLVYSTGGTAGVQDLTRLGVHSESTVRTHLRSLLNKGIVRRYGQQEYLVTPSLFNA